MKHLLMLLAILFFVVSCGEPESTEIEEVAFSLKNCDECDDSGTYTCCDASGACDVYDCR